MKLNKLWPIAFTFTAAALVLCLPALAGHPPSENEAALKAATKRWENAWNRNDIKAVMEEYTDDAKLLPAGSDAVVGREAVMTFLQKIRTATWPDTASFFNIEVYGNGPTATICSEMEFRDKSGAVKGRGKQMLIFLKQADQWKLHRDIWTDNAPAKP